MDPASVLSFLLAAGVGVALVVHRVARNSSLEALAVDDDLDDAPQLGQTGFAVRVPWRDRPDLRRYDLRWGIDSVVYRHATHDDNGNVLVPEIVYTRYSVIGLAQRIPSLRAAAAHGSPAFGRLLRDMARVDAFPSPEGLGVAFTDHDIPAGSDVELWFQQLLDAAFARLVGEDDTRVYLRQMAREDREHGAVCARLLLTHYPECAADDGLPQLWSGRMTHPDTALAAALALGHAQPLFSLALGHGLDAGRTDIMDAAWQAVADELAPQGLIEAMGSASAAVFASAARRALGAGLTGIDSMITRVGDRRESHRTEAIELLAALPAADVDASLVAWMSADTPRRVACARALRTRGSTAASPLLVDWLASPDDHDVDFALQWLGDLGAPDAVGPLRALRDRWLTGGERSQRCEAAIAGILARSGATDGALTFAESSDGGLSVADGE